MDLTAEQLLAVVAIVNALGTNLALLIHELRVPYRESAAREQVSAIDAVTRQHRERAEHPQPPPAERASR